MSAKKSKRAESIPAPAAAAPAAPAAPAAESIPAAPPSWLDSADPRKRLWGKIILVAVWIYVGALCLLALDQTLNLGIFGAKTPPAP